MAASRVRIDRRLHGPQEAPGVVVFRDGWGEIAKRFELDELGLPADVTALLGTAFIGHHAGSTPDTQRGCWRALRIFATFAAEDGEIASAADLRSATIGRYMAWLDRQPGQHGRGWSAAAKANLLSALRQLIDWTKRHAPERLPSRIDFPYNPYPLRNPAPRRKLDEAVLKGILQAAYEEIDGAWERFETGRRILATRGAVEGVDAELCRFVRAIARAGDGIMPPAKAVGIGLSTLNRRGGLRLLAGHLHLGLEHLPAFFLAIAIQTAGNPDALRRLRRDCQSPHPLDEHRVMIDWGKPRAGVKVKRAQRRSFDRRRLYAAPNLIDRLIEMTAPLAARARPQDRELLFLMKSEKTNAVGVVAMDTLGIGIKRFIARANARIAIWNRAAPERRREPLPDFAAAFLRGSAATQVYTASQGDLIAVQALLNHARIDTTERYVRGPEATRVQTETIARAQVLMIAWVLGEAGGMAGTAPEPGRVAAPFGHDCLNPLAGDRPGKPCSRLGACLRCPGLVIPLDAEHLARILQAIEALEAARLALDPARWSLIYGPSHRILVDDILPDFARDLHDQARAIMATLPALPVLE
jgi:integrase